MAHQMLARIPGQHAAVASIDSMLHAHTPCICCRRTCMCPSSWPSRRQPASTAHSSGSPTSSCTAACGTTAAGDVPATRNRADQPHPSAMWSPSTCLPAAWLSRIEAKADISTPLRHFAGSWSSCWEWCVAQRSSSNNVSPALAAQFDVSAGFGNAGSTCCSRLDTGNNFGELQAAAAFA